MEGEKEKRNKQKAIKGLKILRNHIDTNDMFIE